MKKRNRVLAMLLAAAVLVTMLLTGCGAKKPTADDATAYVQAVMDIICTGEYDHSVKLADVEEGQEGALREELLNAAVDAFTSQVNLDDAVVASFKDFVSKAFSKAKYTINGAEPTDDGGFDVSVSIEPLQLYNGVMEEFQNQMPDILGVTYADIQGMSQDELNNLIYTKLIEFLSNKLDNPTYDAPVDVTVHYGLIDEKEKLYGCSEADGEKLGSMLFSQNY